MQEVHAKPQLVDSDDAGLATRGPSVVVPRSDVEQAISGGEFPARLVVDIGRADTSGEVTAHAQLAVDWDKPELEELLKRAGGGDLQLSFAADEVQRALEDADVEGHGLREKVAVFSIVAATAGAAAGGAFAHPQLADGGSGAVVSSAPTLITDTLGGTGGVSNAPESAPSFITDTLGGTGGVSGGVEADAPSFITDTLGGTGGVSNAPEAAPSFITDTLGGTGGVSNAPEAPSFITDTLGGTGGASNAPDAAPSLITDTLGGTGGVEAADTGGISMPSPAETAGLVGVALLITGAGFVASRSRRERELPA